MRENEFEKQVRKKMDELGFDPSEAVWAGVNKEINQEKKHRRSFFWLFFFSGLLLAGSGYYFFTTKSNPAPLVKKELQNDINNPKEEKLSLNQITVNGPGTKGSEMKPKNKKDSDRIMKTDEDGKKKSLIIKTGQAKLQINRPPNVGKRVSENQYSNNLDEKSDDISINNYNRSPGMIASVTELKQVADSNKSLTKTPLMENKKTQPDSPANNKTETVAGEKKHKDPVSKWNIGYTAGAGISNINQSLFTPIYVSATNLATTAGAASGSTGGNSSPRANPGFSFMAGAFVTRSLSERLALTAGLNYHYYSIRIKTGSKINGNLPVGFSPNQLLNASNYYQNGNDHSYTNQYHFLEIPVTASFLLNKGKKMPVAWELGFSLGYLLSSDALYYDPFAGVYFESSQEANKMQLNAVTAILFGFQLGKNALQAGPEFQYGLTNLYNARINSPGHLLYGGIKIDFIPGKK